jgi:hypothetical protein
LTRPLKGKEPLSETKPLSLTAKQARLWEEWGDTSDFLRRCIDTRYTGSAEERRLRANDLRLKAQELMREAQELDEQVEADEVMKEDNWDEIKREFEALGRHHHDRDMNQSWLMSKYNWTNDQADRFMAWLGDGKGSDREDMVS